MEGERRGKGRREGERGLKGRRESREGGKGERGGGGENKKRMKDRIRRDRRYEYV